ncbi:MAG: transposase [Dehalococcoidia bacterium]|nr:transposase [Dehalococcoidia bacterium]
MARIARAVVPGIPHHVVQRGNRRLPTFFSSADYQAYVDLMHRWCENCGVAIWAYCLMPNHVHLVAVPESEDALARAIGEAHRRYTQTVNAREGWRGHLWHGRFSSYVMDEPYLRTCVRYIETNPVRAGLVSSPTDWPWSSAHAHAAQHDDAVVTVQPLLDIIAEPWTEFLAVEPGADDQNALRRHERTGRPLGSPDFVDKIESRLGRLLRPQRTGRKPTRTAPHGRSLRP